MKREPLLTTAVMIAVVTAALTLLAAFGLPLTPGQSEAIIGFVTVASPLVLAYLARKKVTPVSDPKDEDGNPLTPETDSPELSDDA